VSYNHTKSLNTPPPHRFPTTDYRQDVSNHLYPFATLHSNHFSTYREVLLGITGKDFTIIASSKAAMRGATILKASDDKTRELNKHNLMTFSGEAGDTVQFAEYIQANIQLYSMRNDQNLGPHAVASFVRGELAKSLRSRRPYTVNLLLGGWDEIKNEPTLYWCDYLAALAKVPYAAHGYAQYAHFLLCLLGFSYFLRDPFYRN